MMSSNDPVLFIEIVKLALRIEDKELVRQVVKRSLRFLGSPAEIKYFFLDYISLISDKYTEFYASCYQEFFISSLEKTFIKCKKLEILLKISNEGNIGPIVEELNRYVL